jgi:hypothetical protein
MKTIFASLAFTVLCSSFLAASAFAETIYLKDGAVLRGKIINEDETSISVEMNNAWKKIDKSTIELVKKEDVATPQAPQEPAKAATAPTGDLRLRYGSTAGITEGEISGFTVPMSELDDKGVGYQLDYSAGFYKDSSVGFVLSAGIFSRKHSGNDQDPTFPTQIYYDAAGVNLGAGIGIKASEKLHFEGKLELGIGTGKPKFSTPGVAWNPMDSGGYTSVSFIIGGYITFSNPGFQLGIEVGSQSFDGDFTIQDNFGGSVDGTVSGSEGIVNIALGYRF